ncbi:MAG: hypothetical protein Q4E65_03920 [Clostridia bacterium]|nr:hypothetical protein [Clostridia bacterium]
MKRRVGISPVLVEMVFVLLFFALSATVVVQLLFAAVSMSRKSRDQSAALAAATVAMETLLADPAALAKGDAHIQSGDYTVDARIASIEQGGGVYYSVDCKAMKDEEMILSLQGGRFVGPEVTP